MVVCPRCKTRNAGDAKFCKECSWSIVLMEETVGLDHSLGPFSPGVLVSVAASVGWQGQDLWTGFPRRPGERPLIQLP